MPTVIELAGCVARTGGGAANHIIVPIEDYIVGKQDIYYQEVTNLDQIGRPVSPGSRARIKPNIVQRTLPEANASSSVIAAVQSSRSPQQMAEALKGTNLDGAYVFKNAEGKWCALHAQLNDSFPGVQEEGVFKGLEDAGVLEPQQKQKALNEMVRARCLATYNILSIAKSKNPSNKLRISAAGYYDNQTKYLELEEIIARLQCGTATNDALHDDNAKYDKEELQQHKTQTNDCDILNNWCRNNGVISYNGDNRTVFEHLTDTPVLCKVGDTDIHLMFLNAPNAAGASRPGTGAFIEEDLDPNEYKTRIGNTYSKADALLRSLDVSLPQEKKFLGRDGIIVTTSIGGGAYAGKFNATGVAQQSRDKRINVAEDASKERRIVQRNRDDAQIIVRRKGKDPTDPLRKRDLGFDIKKLIPEMVQTGRIPDHVYSGTTGTVYTKGQTINTAPTIRTTSAIASRTPSSPTTFFAPPLPSPRLTTVVQSSVGTSTNSPASSGKKEVVIELAGCVARTGGGMGNHIIVPIQDYIDGKPIQYDDVTNLSQIGRGIKAEFNVKTLPQETVDSGKISKALRTDDVGRIGKSLEGTNLEGAYIFKNAAGKWCALHAQLNKSFGGAQEEAVFKGMDKAGVFSSSQKKQKALNEMVRARCVKTYEILNKAKGAEKPPTISSAGYYDDPQGVREYLGLAEIIARLQCGTATRDALHDGYRRHDRVDLILPKDRNEAKGLYAPRSQHLIRYARAGDDKDKDILIQNENINDCERLNQWCNSKDQISYNNVNRTVFEHLTDTPVFCEFEGIDIKLMFLNAPNRAGESRPGTGAFPETGISETEYNTRISQTYENSASLMRDKNLLTDNHILVTTSIGGGAYAGKNFRTPTDGRDNRTQGFIDSANRASSRRQLVQLGNKDDAQIIVPRDGENPITRRRWFDIEDEISSLRNGRIPDDIYNGTKGTVFHKGASIRKRPTAQTTPVPLSSLSSSSSTTIIPSLASRPSVTQPFIPPIPTSFTPVREGSKIIEIAGSIGKTGGGAGDHKIVILKPQPQNLTGNLNNDSKAISDGLKGSLENAFVFQDEAGKWCAVQANIDMNYKGAQEEYAFQGLVEGLEKQGIPKQAILNEIVRDRCQTTYDIICDKVNGNQDDPRFRAIIARLQVKEGNDGALPNRFNVDNFRGQIQSALPELTHKPFLFEVKGTNLKLMFMNAPVHGEGRGNATKAFAEPNITSQDFSARIGKVYEESRKLIGRHDVLIPCGEGIGTGVYSGDDKEPKDPQNPDKVLRYIGPYSDAARVQANLHRKQLQNVEPPPEKIEEYINGKLFVLVSPSFKGKEKPVLTGTTIKPKNSGTVVAPRDIAGEVPSVITIPSPLQSRGKKRVLRREGASSSGLAQEQQVSTIPVIPVPAETTTELTNSGTVVAPRDIAREIPSVATTPSPLQSRGKKRVPLKRNLPSSGLAQEQQVSTAPVIPVPAQTATELTNSGTVVAPRDIAREIPSVATTPSPLQPRGKKRIPLKGNLPSSGLVQEQKVSTIPVPAQTATELTNSRTVGVPRDIAREAFSSPQFRGKKRIPLKGNLPSSALPQEQKVSTAPVIPVPAETTASPSSDASGQRRKVTPSKPKSDAPQSTSMYTSISNWTKGTYFGKFF